jgi:hypothetical protein
MTCDIIPVEIQTSKTRVGLEISTCGKQSDTNQAASL